jgi:hypothetical protein
MTKRWINAQIGFFAGSFVYFLFLWIAVLCEHYRVVQHYTDPPDQVFSITCTFGPAEPFWYRSVSHAALSHRMQPHFLYLTALIFAAAFAWMERPIPPDKEARPAARVFSSGLFSAAVIVNLWFSAANVLPQYIRW